MIKNKKIYTPLDSYELDLSDAISKVKNVKRPKDYKKYMAEAVLVSNNTLSKSKTISIRLAQKDLLKVKTKALENGIPYQTLLGSLIGKYAKGEIKLKL